MSGPGVDGATPMVTTAARTRPSRAGRSTWVAGFLLCFGMLAAWSLATPSFAAPDEPAHAFRAASLVRGELLGQNISTPVNPSVRVQVPKVLNSFDFGCFAFRASVPASCMRATSAGAGLTSVSTYTGRYPPLYYLAVGLPSLLPLGVHMLLWMRLAGDLVIAVFLTASFVLLGRRRRSGWAVVGGAVAMTPLVLFMGSVVNPSGLEIASAMALWCALLSWAAAPGRPPDRSTVIWAAVAAIVLESTRGLSPAFMLLTIAACAVVAGWSGIGAAARRHDVRVAGVVVAAFGVLAVTWVVAAGSLRLLRTAPVPARVTTATLIRNVLRRSAEFPGFVGKFGWLDTASPLWVVDVWRVAAIVLVAGVVLGRAWRSAAVVALVLVATIAIPAVGDVLEARTIGLVSQPRYILPVAVGTALVAGTAIRWHGRWSAMAARLILAGLALAQIGAFVHTLQRYRTGIGADVTPGRPEWSPPLGSMATTALFVVAVGGFLAWLCCLGRSAGLPGSIGGRCDGRFRSAGEPGAPSGREHCQR